MSNRLIEDLVAASSALPGDPITFYGEDANNNVCIKAAMYINLLQAKIDMLMIEFCPEEMTQEQKHNWASHQVPEGGHGNG